MLVVMQEGAAEAQIQQVMDRMVVMGFTVHRSTGSLHTLLGGVGPVEPRWRSARCANVRSGPHLGAAGGWMAFLPTGE